MRWQFILGEIVEALNAFWQRYPGLLYGISTLLGIMAANAWHLIVLLPLVALVWPMVGYNKLQKIDHMRYIFAALIVVIAFMYGKSNLILPEVEDTISPTKIAQIYTKELRVSTLPEKKILKANFSIDKIQQVEFYGKQWRYFGKATLYTELGEILGKHVPCALTLSNKLIRPQANCSYHFKTMIKKQRPGSYTLQPLKNTPWTKIPYTYSLAEKRHAAQQAFASYVRREYPNKRTANFLIGISTGDFQDKLMSFEFSRFGLQHIMAISGFHFSILAALLALAFTFFFSKTNTSYLLLMLLTAYFLFIGPLPSVMRAWISACITLCTVFSKRKGSGLNSLGIGLIIVLIFDPSACCKMGFQFSFAATAGILMLYPICEELTQKLFPKRSLSQAIEMSRLNQHAYIVLSFFRQAFSLGLAVNLVAIPLILFYFQTFPLTSVAYNLFFPFLVAMALSLLIIGAICSIILPPIGAIINSVNASFTHFILEYTHNIPAIIDWTFRTDGFPIELIVIEYTLLFFFGMLYTTYRQAHGKQQEWVFL